MARLGPGRGNRYGHIMLRPGPCACDTVLGSGRFVQLRPAHPQMHTPNLYDATDVRATDKSDGV